VKVDMDIKASVTTVVWSNRKKAGDVSSAGR